MSKPEVIEVEKCATCEEEIPGGAENECELCNLPLCSGCADSGYHETHAQTWQDPSDGVSLCYYCTPQGDD